LFQNQRGLVQSENKLDEQFCVSTRLAIMWINNIIEAAQREDVPWAFSVPTVSYEGVNELFHDFARFRSRPDFRDHMKPWFMGESMDSLPEVKGENDGRGDDGNSSA
jgi:hypothetical protein